MKITLVVCLLILCVFAAAQDDQDFVNSADASQDTDRPETVSMNTPYVGIPIGTWKVTDLDATEKESVCNEQLAFCSNECGGQDLVLKNFCNKSTMAWNCKCKNHVPDTPPYGWPNTIAECRGKEATCIKRCSPGTTNGICLKACSQYYKCNQAGSPPSGLQVENEDSIPNYNLVAENMSANSPLQPSGAQLLHASSFAQLSVAAGFFVVILQTFLY